MKMLNRFHGESDETETGRTRYEGNYGTNNTHVITVSTYVPVCCTADVWEARHRCPAGREVYAGAGRHTRPALTSHCRTRTPVQPEWGLPPGRRERRNRVNTRRT